MSHTAGCVWQQQMVGVVYFPISKVFFFNLEN